MDMEVDDNDSSKKNENPTKMAAKSDALPYEKSIFSISSLMKLDSILNESNHYSILHGLNLNPTEQIPLNSILQKLFDSNQNSTVFDMLIYPNIIQSQSQLSIFKNVMEKLSMEEIILKISNPLFNVGNYFLSKQEFQNASLAFSACRQIRVLLGKNHQSYLECLNVLGVSLFQSENFDGAAEVYKEFFSILSISPKERSQHQLTVLQNYATVLARSSNFPKQETVELFQRIRKLKWETYGKFSVEYFETLSDLISFYISSKQLIGVKTVFEDVEEFLVVFELVDGNISKENRFENLQLLAQCGSLLGQKNDDVSQSQLSKRCFEFCKSKYIQYEKNPTGEYTLLLQSYIETLKISGNEMELIRTLNQELMKIFEQTNRNESVEYLKCLITLMNLDFKTVEGRLNSEIAKQILKLYSKIEDQLNKTPNPILSQHEHLILMWMFALSIKDSNPTTALSSLKQILKQPITLFSNEEIRITLKAIYDIQFKLGQFEDSLITGERYLSSLALSHGPYSNEFQFFADQLHDLRNETSNEKIQQHQELQQTSQLASQNQNQSQPQQSQIQTQSPQNEQNNNNNNINNNNEYNAIGKRPLDFLENLTSNKRARLSEEEPEKNESEKNELRETIEQILSQQTIPTFIFDLSKKAKFQKGWYSGIDFKLEMLKLVDEKGEIYEMEPGFFGLRRLQSVYPKKFDYFAVRRAHAGKTNSLNTTPTTTQSQKLTQVQEPKIVNLASQSIPQTQTQSKTNLNSNPIVQSTRNELKEQQQSKTIEPTMMATELQHANPTTHSLIQPKPATMIHIKLPTTKTQIQIFPSVKITINLTTGKEILKFNSADKFPIIFGRLGANSNTNQNESFIALPSDLTKVSRRHFSITFVPSSMDFVVNNFSKNPIVVDDKILYEGETWPIDKKNGKIELFGIHLQFQASNNE